LMMCNPRMSWAWKQLSLQDFPNQNERKGKPNPKSKLWNRNTTSARQEFDMILLQKWNKKEQGCDKKTYPKSMLNILKVIRNFTSTYTFWAPSSKNFFKKIIIYMWPMFTHVWTMNELKLNWKRTKS
jgi:hypothetical protein